MGCNYPIKCNYWDEEKGKCSISPEEFERMIKEGHHPCGLHQQAIDHQAMKEMKEAIENKDYEQARIISKSPFVSWRK